MLNFMRKKRETTPSADAAATIENLKIPQEMNDVKNSDEIGENPVETESTIPHSKEIPEESVNPDPEETFVKKAIAFSEEKGINRSDIEEGLRVLREIRDGWSNGSLTTDMLTLVMKGLEYDVAVKAAREEGEIEGRNKQIDEKYMHPVESDGVPHLVNRYKTVNSSRISSIFDLARKA